MDTFKASARIINVGDELLKGDTVNTGCAVVASFLRKKGVKTLKSVVVGDDREAIFEALSETKEHWVVLTGGLGPTRDDITKESVAAFYGIELVFDERVARRVEAIYEVQRSEMPEVCKKLAFVPEGATVLQNEAGTASGFLFEKEGRRIVLLPGPVPELESVLAFMDATFEMTTSPHHQGCLLLGIGEADVETGVERIREKHPDVDITLYASAGEVRCLFVSDDSDALKRVRSTFDEAYGEYIFGGYEDTAAGVVVAALKERGMTLALAESCTGGMIAAKVTAVPGASSVFGSGYVPYANAAKEAMLDVDRETLATYGAVSAETVLEMADGALKKSGADIALAISGIAGPTGGTAEKPLGTVFYALAYGHVCETVEKHFSGDRKTIREKAAVFGLTVIARSLRDA